jgi:hypothetical protein
MTIGLFGIDVMTSAPAPAPPLRFFLHESELSKTDMVKRKRIYAEIEAADQKALNCLGEEEKLAAEMKVTEMLQSAARCGTIPAFATNEDVAMMPRIILLGCCVEQGQDMKLAHKCDKDGLHHLMEFVKAKRCPSCLALLPQDLCGVCYQRGRAGRPPPKAASAFRSHF